MSAPESLHDLPIRGTKRTLLLLFSAAVLFQAAVVTMVPAGKYLALMGGRDLVLKLAPVDPYSMMSGYYANLNFEASMVPSTKRPSDLKQGQTVYRIVEKGDDGAWHPVSLSLSRPPALPPQQAFLRGTFQPGTGRILYGIESFYIAEEDREELDRAMGRRWEWQPPPPRPKVGPPAPSPKPPPPPDAFAEVKVDSAGRLALVALRVGGKRFKG